MEQHIHPEEQAGLLLRFFRGKEKALAHAVWARKHVCKRQLIDFWEDVIFILKKKY
jgi:hypothetical protein